MMGHVKRWLEPPSYPDDEAKSAAARITNTLGLYFLLALVIAAAVFVPLFSARKIGNWAVIAGLGVVYGISRHLLFRGHLSSSRVILLTSVWLLYAGLGLFAGGIASPFLLPLAAVAVVATQSMSSTLADVTLASTVLATFGMALFEQLGGSLPAYFRFPAVSSWFLFAAALVVMNRVVVLGGRGLKRSEARFRAVVEHSHDGILFLDREGGILYRSPSFAAISGYFDAERIGNNAFETVHPDDLGELRRAYEDLARAPGASAQMVYRYRHASGSWRWVESSATNLLGNPDIGGVVAASRDITERKRSEAMQARRLAFDDMASRILVRLSTCADEQLDAVVVGALGEAGGFLEADHAYVAAVQGDGTSAVTHEWWRAGVQPRAGEGEPAGSSALDWEVLELRASGAVSIGDCKDQREAGAYAREGARSVLATSTAGTDGRPSGALVFHRHALARSWDPLDVAGVRMLGDAVAALVGRRRADAALRESEGRLRGIAENIADTILRSDRAGRITYVNHVYPGLTRDQVLSATVFDFVPPEQRPVVEAALVAAFERGETSRYESSGPAAQGRSGTYEVSVSPVYVDRRISSAVFLARDITDHRRTQEALRQAQKMESVGRLAGGVAHDFNNMLGIILGHAEIAMGQAGLPTSVLANLQEIQTAAERSANLTRQLLAFARKQTVAPVVLDLNDTVEGTLKMLRRLIGKNVELRWLPDTRLWPVRMDPGQIDQVLANLCVNARDAIAGVGTVTIETGNATFGDAYCLEHPGYTVGDYVLLAVRDDGSGMDKEIVGHLFEPFFTTKGVGKGTGLGLATVYGIVTQNSGFVDVSSEPGEGTTFRIYLPRHAGETGRSEAGGRADPVVRGRETVLLVEDEAALLALGRSMLESVGYTVMAAGTPGEAIQLARQHSGRIHLLMTDVVMPEMNGRELARNLLSLYPDLRCLFMSGYTADAIAHHGVLEPGVHFVQKPFSMATMAAQVREALD